MSSDKFVAIKVSPIIKPSVTWFMSAVSASCAASGFQLPVETNVSWANTATTSKQS